MMQHNHYLIVQMGGVHVNGVKLHSPKYFFQGLNVLAVQVVPCNIPWHFSITQLGNAFLFD